MKCVSKVERLFYVIPVLELIILFVWNLNWRRHPKESGAVHIAKTMVCESLIRLLKKDIIKH